MASFANKKIKIAQVITRLDQGGSPEIVFALLEQLDPSCFDMTLITGLTRNIDNRFSDILKSKNINPIYLPCLIRNINPVLDVIAFFRLLKIFKKEKFDLVHTHTSKAGALGRLAAKAAGVPVAIYNTHGHVFYGYFNKFFSKLIVCAEKLLAGFTDVIVTLSDREKKDFIDYKIADSNKLRVIYNGIDLDKFTNIRVDIEEKKRELGLPLQEMSVGLISRLEPIKNPVGFIEAVKIVCDSMKGVNFLIVGEGSLGKDVEGMASKLGIIDRVIFAGFRHDIPQILKSLDLVALSSLNEGLGISLIEAQAAGKPVVATRVGGVPEVVLEGKTGVLVPPGDAKAMAEAIMGLLRDKKRLTQLASNTQDWVRSRFGVNHMLQEYANLYQGLIKNNV